MNVCYIQVLAKRVDTMLINLSQPGKALCFSQYTGAVVSVATFPAWCTGSDAFFASTSQSLSGQEGARDHSDGVAGRSMAENLKSFQEKFLEWMLQIKKKLGVQRRVKVKRKKRNVASSLTARSSACVNSVCVINQEHKINFSVN